MSKAILLSSLFTFRTFMTSPYCVALQLPRLLFQPQPSNLLQRQNLSEKARLVRQTLPSIKPSTASNSKDLGHDTFYTKPDGSRRGYSNWLVRDRIMIGQYPAQTPEEGGPSLRSAKKHVRSLVTGDGGVRLFCSLQSELPPQDDSEAWSRKNGRVYLPPDGGGGGPNEDFPHYFGHYLPLVRAALPETNDGKRPPPIRYLHAPILDLDTPSDASALYELLATLLETMLLRRNDPPRAAGSYHAVYIHCWGGRGRAGLVGACLLSLLYPEIDADACLEWVQRGYDTREGAEMMPVALRRSPQTEAQREFVRVFAEDVRR